MSDRLKTRLEISMGDMGFKRPTAQFYDATQFGDVNRSWIWQPPQTARRDLSRYTRTELNKKAESLWKNSTLIRAVIERLVTLIIGSGAFPIPKSSNKEFNAELKTYLARKLRNPCVDNLKNFGNYQRVKMRAMLKHGTNYTLFVTDPRDGSDKIQGLEWHRCVPPEKKDEEKPKLTFGEDEKPNEIKSDSGAILHPVSGLPVAYNFSGKGGPVDASLVVHHCLINRDEQTEGESILAAAINTAHDIKDILDLEKAAVKDASGRRDIIRTMTGDLDPQMQQLSFGVGGPVAVPNVDGGDRQAYYAQRMGGDAVVLRKGDEYTPYEPKRPGGTWGGFMAFLSNSVVGSTGFPASVCLPIDIGGTDIRRDIQIAQKVAETFQDDFIDDLQRIAEFFIEGGIERREFKSEIPKDWNALEWYFTGSITVDRSRDSDRRQAVKDGLLSSERYYGEIAIDGDEEEQVIVNEAKRRRLRIANIPLNAPFKDAKDFKQWLALGTDSLNIDEPAPAPAKQTQTTK